MVRTLPAILAALAGAAAAAALPAEAACSTDGLALRVQRGATPGAIALDWAGADTPFRVYRAATPGAITDPASVLGDTAARTWTDQPPPGPIQYYLVASTSDLHAITFALEGALGNFDQDFGVPDLAHARMFGATSIVDHAADGFDTVSSRLSQVDASAPRCALDLGPLNEATPLNDPVEGALHWRHEVSTIAWHAATRRWVMLWHTYPANAAGDRLFSYGWIGLKTMSNTASPPPPAPPLTTPAPDLATLSPRETRLFIGLLTDSRLFPASEAWATGTPRDPVPGDTRYVLFTEPGALFVGDVLYLALTGMTCPGNPCIGDVLLFSSNDEGATWTYRGRPLAASDAARFNPTFQFFTAPSMYVDPGSGRVRLIVSPQNPLQIYQGLFEFEFADLAAATLKRDATGTPIATYVIPPASPLIHEGAGSFDPLTGGRMIGKTFGGEPAPFRVFEKAP